MRSKLFLLVFGLVMVAIGRPIGATLAQAQEPAEGGYAHPEWFAEVDWLKEHLGDDDLAIVALTPAEEFAAGHVPGSAQIDWKALEVVETSDASVANWRGDVEAILTQMGIERGDTVVVYDGGTFTAARLWWILHQLGHDDVRILNGGLEAWAVGGGQLATGESAVTPARTPYVGAPNEEALVQIAEAEAALDQEGTVFVDARRFEDEYAVGHVPGAVNVPFMANAAAEGPKYWKPAAELRAMYENAGVAPDQRVIAYCATGVRSSVTYFTLQQLGYEDVGVFTGSFVEWSSDPTRPVAAGETP